MSQTAPAPSIDGPTSALPYRIPPLYSPGSLGRHPAGDRIARRLREGLDAEGVLDDPGYLMTYEGQDLAEMVACFSPTAGIDDLVEVGSVFAIGMMADNPQTGDAHRPILHHHLTGGSPTIDPRAVAERVVDPEISDAVPDVLSQAFLRALRRLPGVEGNDKRGLMIESFLTWFRAEVRVERLETGGREPGLEEAVGNRLETMGELLIAAVVLPLFPSVTTGHVRHPEVLRIESLITLVLSAHNELYSGYSDLASGSKSNWVRIFAREAGGTLQQGAERVAELADRAYAEARRSTDALAARGHDESVVAFLEAQLSILANALEWWYPRQMAVRYRVPGLDLSHACPTLTSRPQAVGAPGIGCLDHLWSQDRQPA
ncbi:terpene synthase family protein [Kitasatospora sp. NPDC096077]|uniref:terpene synthase family protein n=1 Tax=Kitasatospora sp. NPDC096077 TaxID=3155544 RepID=UPI0033260429